MPSCIIAPPFSSSSGIIPFNPISNANVLHGILKSSLLTMMLKHHHIHPISKIHNFCSLDFDLTNMSHKHIGASQFRCAQSPESLPKCLGLCWGFRFIPRESNQFSSIPLYDWITPHVLYKYEALAFITILSKKCTDVLMVFFRNSNMMMPFWCTSHIFAWKYTFH